MKKLINATLAGLMLAGFTIAIAGCADETGVTNKTEIKGSGGTTTVTDKQTVKKTGENPPAVPGDSKAP
jgi:hypothetical protein